MLNKKHLATFLVLFVPIAMMASAQSDDPRLKAALYEIERAEGQIASATPGQKAKINRISNMVDGAQAQLDGVKQRDSPEFAAAKSRLDALQAQLARLQSPATASAPTGSQLSPADLKLLEGIDRQADSLGKELKRYSPADVSLYQAQLSDRVSGMKLEYRRLGNPTHPQAIAVGQKVVAIEKQINDQLAARAAQDSASGDVVAEAAKIEQRMHPSNRQWFGTPVPSAPFTQEKVESFATQMNAWQDAATKDLQYLQGIQGKTTKVDVDGLMRRVQSELDSIKRYNDDLAGRLERVFVDADQTAKHASGLRDNGTEFAVTKLEQASAMLPIAAAFDASVGRAPTDTSKRRRQYQETLVVLRQKAATAAAAPRTTAAKGKQPATIQRIEMYGTRLVEVTDNGEVWIDGGKEGDITKDGEIWVAGDKEGDLTSDGEVWKAGERVGQITPKGEVWRNGDLVGNVESDGTIWIDGNRQGWFKGGSPSHAATLVFFGFFGL